MSRIKIEARARGPLVISGALEDLELVDSQGTQRDVSGMSKVRLCRCGHSKSAPFCDGSHNRVGFEAPEEQGPSDC